mgnify:FL=1|jgi:hypothetical protein
MRILFRCLAAGALLALSLQALAQNPVLRATDKVRLRLPAGVSIPNPEVAAMTRFDPARHGYRFSNSFANNVIPEFDYRTDGLCGGMVFSVLDYFYAGMPVPDQPYRPGEGSPLRRYLYDRQVQAITHGGNLTRWVEMSVNPFGSRNDEFFNWGFEGRLDELKRRIQRGEPVPLAMRSCDEGCMGDHYVLAVGYDFGTWKRETDPANRDQVKIFLYDPNHPGQTVTLKADLQRKQYYLAESTGSRWRAWFIADYARRTPPAITRPTREVVVRMDTGNDDLRGGNDNVHIVLLGHDGREQRYENVNYRKRWVNHSTEEVSLALPDDFHVDNLRGLRVETTFGGGIGGDNWNLSLISARYYGPEGERQLLFGSRGARFTGSHKRQEFPFD